MNRPLLVQAVKEYFIDIDNVGECLFALGELLRNSEGKTLFHLEGLASLVGVIGSDLLLSSDMGKKALETLDTSLLEEQTSNQTAPRKGRSSHEKKLSPKEVLTTS